MNPSLAFSALPMVVCILLLLLRFRTATAAAPSWPCLMTSSNAGVCDDKQPTPTPCKPGPGGQLACDPPDCSSDADCLSYGCDTSSGKCREFVVKKDGDRCNTHTECGFGSLCTNTGVCKALPSNSDVKLLSSFKLCEVKPPKGCNFPMELCRADPGAGANKGVCLLDTKDPAQQKIVEEAVKPSSGTGAAGLKEGQPCTTGTDRCEPPFFCDKDGICKKTTLLRSPVSGHRMPPPPGDMNCRDALDSGETDEANSKCKDRDYLCTEPLYVELMREQCPKTCGYCDNPTQDLTDYDEEEEEGAEARDTGRGGAAKTVKVNPSASCSDRKLADKDSDCPKLKGLCDESIYKTLMQEQCPKTCGFCK